MSISFNFDLLSAMFWAFFLGLSLTMGVGMGLIFLAYITAKVNPKNAENKTATK
jgi:hypothetical protein